MRALLVAAAKEHNNTNGTRPIDRQSPILLCWLHRCTPKQRNDSMAEKKNQLNACQSKLTSLLPKAKKSLRQTLGQSSSELTAILRSHDGSCAHVYSAKLEINTCPTEAVV